MKRIKAKEQKGKRLEKSEQRLRDLWETLKPVSICFVGVPEGEERKGQREYLK